MKKLLLAFAASVFASFNAGAVVVYEQLPGLGSSSERISSTLNNFGLAPGFRTADDFVLSADAVISDLHWWGEGRGGTDFLFTFYADAAGAPGAILHSSAGSLSSAAVNVGSGFDPVNFYSSDLASPFAAAAGVTYWISVFNQAADASWLWLAANTRGNGSQQAPIDGAFVATPSNMAFQLTASATAVPEPATLVLFGIALAALGLRRRKRIPV